VTIKKTKIIETVVTIGMECGRDGKVGLPFNTDMSVPSFLKGRRRQLYL